MRLRQLCTLALAVSASILALPSTSAADSKTWLLAEGATTALFEEEILVANPNAAAATVDFTFLKSDGTTVAHQLVVPATSRATVRVNDFVPNDAVSTVVTSDLDIIAERSMYFPAAPRRGAHNAVGVNAAALTWYLAEGSTGFFDTFVLIANPSTTTDADVRVTFLRSDGGAPVVKTYPVPKNSRFTVWVNSMVPELAQSAFSTVVESQNAVEIIVERAMYFGNFEGGHVTTGVSALSSTWRFAEGFTGAGFDTFLLLGNPDGAATAQVRVTFFLETGAPIERFYNLPPTSRLDIWVDQIAGLDNAPFSILVESQNAVDIVAERAEYWNGFIDGHVTTGLTASASIWGFAEGLEDGHLGTFFQTYYLFSNSSGMAVDVKGTFYREDGTGIVRNFTIPAQSRYTLPAATYPELSNQRFAAFFESTNGGTFIAERAVYYDDTFFAGHASPGTPWMAAPAAPPAPPAPTTTAINPASGLETGGTPVTITGTDYATGATVTIGGLPASNVVVVNATTITAETPARTPGTVDVVVTSNGTANTLAGAFTFNAAGPPPPPPPPPGFPSGPPAAQPPQPPPNMFHIVQQVANQHPGWLATSHTNRNFIFEVVRRLRQIDNRWGLNWKRGVVGSLSTDVIDYHYGVNERSEGSTNVYLVDIVLAIDSPNPRPAWTDVTGATANAGTIGRWTIVPCGCP